MIDWRAWILSALARRLGFSYHLVGIDARTGGRAFLFASTPQIAHALAMQDCIQAEAQHRAEERLASVEPTSASLH